jgi:hypothetical protein
VACGSGTAETPGTMLCTAEDIARLGVTIVVQRIRE